MDLLLDVDVVLDLCTPRPEWYQEAREAVARCREHGGRVWLYAGSVQTMDYALRQALMDRAEALGQELSRRAAAQMSRSILHEFARDKHWLAALADEGDVFASDDPEDEQLIRAMDRFGEGKIWLITRDERLKAKTPLARTPMEYLEMDALPAPTDFIDLRTQQDGIRPRMEKRIHQVLHHGRYIMGPEIEELETRLAEYVGVKHAIGCANGTDALLMALISQGAGPGDAIFTTPFTFIATAEVISLLGATPVFVDIEPGTFNLDPAKLEAAVQAVKKNDHAIHPLPTPGSGRSTRSPLMQLRPKGVIPVDLFGLPADYDRINAIAQSHDLFAIEDAAQSFGAEYNGRRCCSLTDIACTSFFPAKPLGCYGDGGMCFTDDDEAARVLRSIRVHGMGEDKYENIRIGINGRLDALQAAILLAKLRTFPEEVRLRQEVAERYGSALRRSPAGAAAFTLQHIPSGYTSVWAQYSILARDNDYRTTIQKVLKKAGIPTAIYYPKPLHMQQAFASLGYKKGDFPVSESHAERIFSIPMHPYLNESEQERITEALCGP